MPGDEDENDKSTTAADLLGPDVRRGFEKTARQQSLDIRNLRRDLDQFERTLSELKGTNRGAPRSGKRLGVAVPVVVLSGLIIVLVAGLGWLMNQSHADFGRGIDVAKAGFDRGESSSAVSRRIFLLASGNQIVTFKAAAFVISGLMFFVGAVFVLVKADVAYSLSAEREGLKASLSTSSPGLVIVTLSVALAIATLYAKSKVADQPDWDLAAPAASSGASAEVSDFDRDYAEHQRERAAAAKTTAAQDAGTTVPRQKQ